MQSPLAPEEKSNSLYTSEQIMQARASRAKWASRSLRYLKKYKPADFVARKQYWYGQAIFLDALFRNLGGFCEQKFADPKAALDARIAQCLDDPKSLDIFIKYVEDMHAQDPKKLKDLKEEKNNPVKNQLFRNANIIAIVTEISSRGELPVVGAAANSNRDGSAKYFKGSLEELLCRHTNSMFALMTHFKVENNPEQTKEFQRRYARLCFRILQKVLKQGDPYLESHVFLQDLVTERGDAKGTSTPSEPIFFDFENTVYEVPAGSGHASFCQFVPEVCGKAEDLTKALNEPEPPPTSPIVLISTAAPDRRRLESNFDKRCSTNHLLQTPEKDSTLQEMIVGGINFQCTKALELKAQGQKPHVVFVLPGCGAFANPLHKTADIFVAAIKKHREELEAKGIPFCIVELNRFTYAALYNAWHHPGMNQEIAQQNAKKYAVLYGLLGFFSGTVIAGGWRCYVHGLEAINVKDFAANIKEWPPVFYNTLAIMGGILAASALLTLLIYYRKKPIPYEEIKFSPETIIKN